MFRRMGGARAWPAFGLCAAIPITSLLARSLMGIALCGRARARSHKGSTHPTSLRHLEQDLRQPVGHVDHDVVAAWHLVDAPAGARLELVASRVERRVRIAGGADVGLLGDAVARAG